MSKIAIISQPDQGVLIDVSGCTTLKEALEHLSSTLQVSSQFWKGMNVSLNLGKLELGTSEISQILALAKGVGIQPSGVYTNHDTTRESLLKNGVPLGSGTPMTLPTVPLDLYNHYSSEIDEQEKKKGNSAIATIKMRMADAIGQKKVSKGDDHPESLLEDMAPLEGEANDEQAKSKPSQMKVRKKVSLDGRPAPPVDSENGNTAKHVQMADTNTAIAESKSEPADAAVAIDVTAPVLEDPIEALLKEAVSQATEAPQENSDDVECDAEEVTEAEDSIAVTAECAAEECEAAETVEADALEAQDDPINCPNTLYLQQNLRSGQTVSHKGHLVIIGDINPGAEVMAEGDITVWGSLRGVAHAGIGGNVNAEIRALKLQPIQIRIAQAIARAPDRPRLSYAQDNGPETARIVAGKIKVFRSRLE